MVPLPPNLLLCARHQPDIPEGTAAAGLRASLVSVDDVGRRKIGKWAMPERLLLVDLENVQTIDLSSVPPNSRIKIFYGTTQKKLPAELVAKAQPLGLLSAHRQGDFQLISARLATAIWVR